MAVSEDAPTNEQQNRRLTFHTWCCILLTTVSAMLMGYDVGIMSSAILFITEELKLSTLKQEVIVGSLNLVAAVGAIAAGFFANRFGRRDTLGFAAFVFFVGAVILAAAPGFSLLMVGRVLTGIGVGFAMMIAPLYSAEISPARVRGFLVSFTEIFVDVGILLGYVVGFVFQFLDPSYNWRLMLGVGALPAIILAYGTIFILPESPRWLVMHGRHEDAMKVLEITVCAEDDKETQRRLVEIIEANEAEQSNHSSGGFTWSKLRFSYMKDRLRSPSFCLLARMYVVALGVNFFQQAAGIEATVYYSPVVFKIAGVKSRLGMLGATMGVGLTKLAFVLVATFTLDKVGRKKLLILSSSGIILCLIIVMSTFVALKINVDPTKVMGGDRQVSLGSAVVIVVAICTYIAFFSMGWGPIAYVIASEVFPLSHRSKALGWSMFVNRAVSGTVALTFLSMAQAMTPAGAFGLFTAFTVLSILFVTLVVPETKGKTLEELGQGGGFAPLHNDNIELGGSPL
ncbi:hypothetical protein GOP47_0023674 [Adiantum capillus-veneris]|uniref:Major facilitator superfamily (MFS) profile domain-containing protein n=1 Tax=Adiantum capillus-veneris TaxID=13818 RepID=A0A9D4U645_ADICA|nr:hypothetical protein GOP47_0023674 [Adiantum capillus-veneris]